MEPLQAARLVEGKGLEGNVPQGGRRQVTVIAREAWERVEEELGQSVDPSARRANLMVAGVELAQTEGRILEVGGCRIVVRGETRPCDRMDEQADGLQEVLRPGWRGGVYGQVLRGGAIEVGDPVRWEGEDGSS